MGSSSSERWLIESGPSWSINSREMVYVAFENGIGSRHLAIYDTLTARVDFLYRGAASLYDPQFSPDGSQILYMMASTGAG